MLNSVHCEKTSESCLKKLQKKIPRAFPSVWLRAVFSPPYILETDFAGLPATKHYHL